MKALVLTCIAVLGLAAVMFTKATGHDAGRYIASTEVFGESYVADFHTLTKEEVDLLILDAAKTNPDMVRSLANEPARRKEQLDGIKKLLTYANQCVRSGFATTPYVKTELENIRVEIISTEFEKRKFPTAKPFGSSVTDTEAAEYKKRSGFKTAFDAFVDAKVTILKQETPDVQITDEERSQAADVYARTRILAAKAAADVPKMSPGDVLKFATEVKLQQAQFLSGQYVNGHVVKDETPIADADLAAYRKSHGLTGELAESDDEVRRDIRRDRVEATWPQLAKDAGIQVPDDFAVPAIPLAVNINANRAVNRPAGSTNANRPANRALNRALRNTNSEF